jgi:hypothetical protein
MTDDNAALNLLDGNETLREKYDSLPTKLCPLEDCPLPVS